MYLNIFSLLTFLLSRHSFSTKMLSSSVLFPLFLFASLSIIHVYAAPHSFGQISRFARSVPHQAPHKPQPHPAPHPAPAPVPKRKHYIDTFEIDNSSGAKTKILPIELGIGLGTNVDLDTKLANGVLRDGPLPNGLLGHVDPKGGLIGTLAQSILGKDPLGLGLGGNGLNFDLDIPDLSLGLGLGKPGSSRGKEKDDDSVLESLLGDDPVGQLLGSLLKL